MIGKSISWNGFSMSITYTAGFFEKKIRSVIHPELANLEFF